MAGDELRVQLGASGMDELHKFEEIVTKAFPESGLTRLGPPTRGGILNMMKVLTLAGKPPAGGSEEVARLLALLSECLTIEDSLDESHALAHHTEPNEEGELERSALGQAMYRAKYRSHDSPKSTSLVRVALARFIQQHPRYRSATRIGAVPPHESTKSSSVCRDLTNDIAPKLGMSVVQVKRAVTRETQKNIQDEDRRQGSERRFENQRESMGIDDDLRSQNVVLIDDLYGSGGSMAEAARAARQAGASSVLGLTVTKQRLYEGIRAS